MIRALIISNICLILILKGVPTWLWSILSIGYVGCNTVALILWEETKDKIKRLENKMKMKGGE